jgi:hypothetical protein
MQIKTAMKYHLAPVRMAIKNKKCWKGYGEKELIILLIVI